MQYLYWLLADLYVFFIMYVATMNMIKAHANGVLNGLLWVLCLPFVAISWFVDVVHNLTLLTFIFAELPGELTVTERLKRHIKAHTYRGKIARFICAKILSPFDHTGNHCD